MHLLKAYYDIERRIKIAAVIFSITAATFITGIVLSQENMTRKAKVQENLSEEVLRFHVLANSDSAKDQALKLKVKEEVLTYIEQTMPETQSADETSQWMRKHIDELEEISKEVIHKEGYDYTVSVAVTTCWFPDKTYGDLTFPQGNYKALRIEIGDAKGQNWWCVLYPGLCFVDTINAVVPEEGKGKLKAVLSAEEYSCLTDEKDYKIGFYFMQNILTFM